MIVMVAVSLVVLMVSGVCSPVIRTVKVSEGSGIESNVIDNIAHSIWLVVAASKVTMSDSTW